MVTLKLAIKANVYFFFKETKLNIMIFSTVFKEGLLEESKKIYLHKNQWNKTWVFKTEGAILLIRKDSVKYFSKS